MRRVRDFAIARLDAAFHLFHVFLLFPSHPVRGKPVISEVLILVLRDPYVRTLVPKAIFQFRQFPIYLAVRFLKL